MEDSNKNGIPDDFETLGIVFYIFLAFTIVGIVIAKSSGLLGKITIGGVTLQEFWDLFVAAYLPIFQIMSVFLSLALIVFIVYVIRETNKVVVFEKEKLKESLPAEAKNKSASSGVVEQEQDVEDFNFGSERWQKVVSLINSKEASDWKLAILEADIMLGELLDKIGYHGNSIGEQLKLIEKSDFRTLDQAWEAHKTRNSIAHQGQEFLINHREAQRIIRLYEEVFLEFKYI